MKWLDLLSFLPRGHSHLVQARAPVGSYEAGQGRRHIAQLRDYSGCRCSTVDERRYRLTQAVVEEAPYQESASSVLARGKVWIGGNT